jgi:hypothetical protein
MCIKNQKGCTNWRHYLLTSLLTRDIIKPSSPFIVYMSNIQCISFLGSLKQQKSLLSQFWRLQVQNQGVGRAKLLLKALGENPFQAFLLPSSVTSNPWVSLACSCITTICFHCHLASFPVRLCPNFLLLIMTPCIRLWPILVQYGIITT